jgi:hypothetical protein
MGCATLPPDVEALVKSIRPTAWSGSKVSAIDLSSDFAWVDDEPLAVEVAALQARNLSSRLIIVNTNKDDQAILHATGRESQRAERRAPPLCCRHPRRANGFRPLFFTIASSISRFHPDIATRTIGGLPARNSALFIR